MFFHTIVTAIITFVLNRLFKVYGEVQKSNALFHKFLLNFAHLQWVGFITIPITVMLMMSILQFSLVNGTGSSYSFFVLSELISYLRRWMFFIIIGLEAINLFKLLFAYGAAYSFDDMGVKHTWRFIFSVLGYLVMHGIALSITFSS